MSDHIVDRLAHAIQQRATERPAGSYVVSLLDGGPVRAGDKVLEEARELVESAVGGAPESAVVHEAADLLFHALVLLATRGIEAQPVWAELERRFGTGGHAEKAARGAGR